MNENGNKTYNLEKQTNRKESKQKEGNLKVKSSKVTVRWDMLVGGHRANYYFLKRTAIISRHLDSRTKFLTCTTLDNEFSLNKHVIMYILQAILHLF